MHGGALFYKASAANARRYVEADRSAADDYYLGEGSGLVVHCRVHGNAGCGWPRLQLSARPMSTSSKASSSPRSSGQRIR